MDTGFCKIQGGSHPSNTAANNQDTIGLFFAAIPCFDLMQLWVARMDQEGLLQQYELYTCP
jgi:hypothetical protein